MTWRPRLKTAAAALCAGLALAGGAAAARSPENSNPAVREARPEGWSAAERLNGDVNDRNARAADADRAAEAEYARRLKAYEAKKKADAEAFARAQREYERQLAETEARRQRELAEWEARVRACKAGDRAACGPR